MRGIGEGGGERVINPKSSSYGGPARLLVLVLAACAPEDPPPIEEQVPPDASVAAEIACPDGVVTWRDALIYWDEIRCTAQARCFPDNFAMWFGDQAGCMAELGSHHCKGGTPENWCDFDYPRSRCELLSACHDDAAALACDPDVDVPASCDAALH